MAKWGLAQCIEDAWNAEHPGKPDPSSLQELVDWGNTTGRRNRATGEWACAAGTYTGGGTTAPPDGTLPVLPGDPFAGIMSWISANPVIAIGAALLLFMRKR